MDLESLDALVNLIITIVPISLALFGTVFGLQRRRRAASAKEASVSIFKLAHEPDTPAVQRQRRWLQLFDVVVWLSVLAALAFLALSLALQQTVNMSPSRNRTLLLLADFGIVLVYVVVIWMYARALIAIARTPPGRPSHAAAEMSLVVGGSVRRLLRRSHQAVRRFGADVREIDATQGLLRARRHFFFNVYKTYFDEITIHIQPLNEQQCTVTIASDGLMPSLVRNRTRNQQNIVALIGFITE